MDNSKHLYFASKLGKGGLLIRWVSNLIVVQEKKEYNFFVILIFAAFVGLIRHMLEILLANRPMFSLNLSMLHMFVFYLHCIFIYTFILKIFIKEFEWKKSIHLVLIGVFLGIFPPVIDTIVYGAGNYQYGYVDNFLKDWRLLIINEDAHVPVGEASVLYLTMFFTALVVYLKTNNVFKSLLALVACYAFIFIYAALLPFLAIDAANFFRTQLGDNAATFLMGDISQSVFSGFPNMFYISIFQLFFCVFIYFLLNPVLIKKLPVRLNHALPVVLTCFLGYAAFKPIDFYICFAAVIFLFASIVTIFQNDFFDKDEDALDKRESYLCIDDVRFFNTILLTIIALLAAAGSYLAYMLLLFFIVSVIYNYDFYRGKSYFPANYKIEGVWGLSAYMAGLAMVMLTTYSLAGDILLVNQVEKYFGQARNELSQSMASEMFNASNILMMFCVFGGWSIISVIKDYKDIDSDLGVGNQTVYTLLLKKGKNISVFHQRYSLVLSILMLLPFIWLSLKGAHFFNEFALVLCALLFYFTANQKPSNKTVELSLGVINLYLLNLVLGAHFSY